MKDFSKATPRPWQQNFLKSFIETSDKTKNICEMSVNENDANFSYDEYRQNGELIITAVNNFDKMKEALEEILRFKDSLRLVMSDKLQYPDNFLKSINDAEQLLESLK